MTESALLTNSNNTLLKSITARFKKGAFLRNLSVVMTGTAMAQLISFAMMPIVSRLFTTSDFGIFGSYNAVFGVLSTAVTFQYAQAIVLPKYKEDSVNLFYISCLSIILVTTIIAISLILFPRVAQNLVNAPNKWFLLLFLAAVFISGLNQTFQAWCIRVKAFKPTSTSQVIRSVSSISIWITVGFRHMGALGLAVGAICADLLASINLWRVVKNDLKSYHAPLMWGKVKQVAHEYRDFPFFSAPQNIMNSLSQGLPVLLLGYFYGIGIAGSYAFGIRIIQAPMTLLLAPLRQVLFQKASEVHNYGGDLYSLFIKTTGGLLVVALVPCAVLFVWSPQIFSWIFGPEWLEAGIFARWLVLWLIVMFINVPAVLFARILRQQKNSFIFDGFVLLLRAVVLAVGGLYWKPLTTIISFSVLGFILNAVFIIWIGMLSYFKKSKNY
jgi:lipopolysaccharide exporter